MISKTLKDCFPMIRTRKEILCEIKNTPKLEEQFYCWTAAEQNQFLDFCTGQKGVKILYDSFFKEVLNPEYNPVRLEKMLSVFLKQNVKIVLILPNDTVRLSDEMTLLITDIIVQLTDGSLVNLEVQKIGYTFPGQRAACYGADALLRQYKRIRDEKGKNFTYRDIQKVYLIVLFESSPNELKQLAPAYIHYGHTTFDTGLQIEMLENFIFVSLDIFAKNAQNKAIDGELEAWLTFLSTDEPERILQLIDAYPWFKDLYNDIYDLCQNTEKVMEMFSKELLELDRNTVRYMIDEMQNTIDAQEKKLLEKDFMIDSQKNQLLEKDSELTEQTSRLQAALAEIEQLKSECSSGKME